MKGRRIETDDAIRAWLTSVRTIAVVGLSPRPHRPSHRVSDYMRRAGYRMLPVHPEAGTFFDEPVHGSLAEAAAAGPFDLVNVFRRPDALPEVVGHAIELGATKLWLQLGVRHDEAEARALEAGIDLVADRCLLVEHQRLFPA